MYRIKLGQEVKDTITGFKGIAVCRMVWLHGCERIFVQPKVGKDGKKINSETFDELGLEIIGDGILVVKSKPPTHGDERLIPEQH